MNLIIADVNFLAFSVKIRNFKSILWPSGEGAHSDLCVIAAGHADEAERRLRQGLAAKRDAEQVLAQLSGRKVDEESLVRGDDVRLDLGAGGAGDGDGKVRLARALSDHPELLQTVDRRR